MTFKLAFCKNCQQNKYHESTIIKSRKKWKCIKCQTLSNNPKWRKFVNANPEKKPPLSISNGLGMVGSGSVSQPCSPQRASFKVRDCISGTSNLEIRNRRKRLAEMLEREGLL